MDTGKRLWHVTFRGYTSTTFNIVAPTDGEALEKARRCAEEEWGPFTEPLQVKSLESGGTIDEPKRTRKAVRQ